MMSEAIAITIGLRMRFLRGELEDLRPEDEEDEREKEPERGVPCEALKRGEEAVHLSPPPFREMEEPFGPLDGGDGDEHRDDARHGDRDGDGDAFVHEAFAVADDPDASRHEEKREVSGAVRPPSGGCGR